MAGHRYPLEVRPVIPAALGRLEELAANLVYSWDRRMRALFRRIDPALWDACDHNPTIFLRRVAQERLDELTEDADFLREYNAVLAAFDQYRTATEPSRCTLEGIDPANDLIAYMCMEYGLHESMHLYSGGLGILAGDHCKAAADLGLPFVAVGLMYRQGYFTQTIDYRGQQVAHYHPARLGDLPVEPVLDDAGELLRIAVPFPGRDVHARIWRALIGHVRLYLLDTEVPDNRTEDRAITYQLYGGDRDIRLSQEKVLGIGGVRALRALGLNPTVWHINEGHPAFSILERCREQVGEGHDFATAMEDVAAATVFTTHTPVPAGHDLFPREAMRAHFREFAAELGISLDELLALGQSPQNHDRFNMTALALRGSRRHNGVSRIHGRVASRMESYVWPQVPPEDNPIGHITNGVHIPTFLARDWMDLFDAVAPEWRGRLSDIEYWDEAIEAIPDQRFWATRQVLKSHLMRYLGERLTLEYERRQVPQHRIRSMQTVFSETNTRPLVIGFARRFATYKRALLLFHDPVRLTRLLNDPERPVILVFAGKAHPADEPGQALIRGIHQHSEAPTFRNRVFFVEGYGMTLARILVGGVDVWLNTPEYPLEASGTSGQKAAMNGSINLSVLDGWWGEAWDGTNGWAITPHNSDLDPAERDRIESEELLDLLEHEVIPAWYTDDGAGYSESWVGRAKASMKTIIPRFNAERMVCDYVHRLYAPAITHGRHLHDRDAARARDLAQWKRHASSCWGDISLSWAEAPPRAVSTGDRISLRVALGLNGLAAEEIAVECVMDVPGESEPHVLPFTVEESGASGDALYVLELPQPPNGLLHYRVRARPDHPDLDHPFEAGLVAWL